MPNLERLFLILALLLLIFLNVSCVLFGQYETIVDVALFGATLVELWAILIVAGEKC